MNKIDKFDVNVNVILNGLEKYMAFTITKSLVFYDSMQFIKTGIEKLVKTLSDTVFKYLLEEFNLELLKLVKQKGVCPYEYMDSSERFPEDKLPDQKYFFSFLGDGHQISREEYLYAVKIWNYFHMKKSGEYHNDYLKREVIFLADVFDEFINQSLKFYKLDPCYYFSFTGLNWDAILK